MTTPGQHVSVLNSSSSHELRNALFCIHQFGRIMLDGLAGELTSEQREYLGIMMENASTIRKVLDGAPVETLPA
jgi:signal transduction histidine kinase